MADVTRLLPNFARQPRIRGRYASPATTWTRINAEGKEEARELLHFNSEEPEEPDVLEQLRDWWQIFRRRRLGDRPGRVVRG